MIKVMHVITTLNDGGGAERLLCDLLRVSDHTRFHHEAVSLTTSGEVCKYISIPNESIYDLNMKRGVPDPRGISRLSSIIRNQKPDVLHTWMYHANLVGGFSSLVSGRIPVIWSIHNLGLEHRRIKNLTMITDRMCAALSKTIPKSIVCCSENAKIAHARIGYDDKRMIVIPNGVDTEAFTPNITTRKSLIEELCLQTDAILIGNVARYDPQKDHSNFIKAAGFIKKRIPEARFIMCGCGIESSNAQLMRLIAKEGLVSDFSLLGLRRDIPRILSALDIFALSSIKEAFGIVIAEAMACGIPCVATDSGSASYIVGDSGRIVEKSNPQFLADAIIDLVNIGIEGRSALGIDARNRIKDLFSIEKCVSKYEEVYSKTVNI